MMKSPAFFLFLFLASAMVLPAQTPNQLLHQAYQRFARVKSFKSSVAIHFDLPSISIEDMSGRAYFKAPEKFRVRLTGIAFLPKDNP
ncbi:MAG: hypothetical protein JNK89_05085, partial [Saprospiraceae bacterium]|nr:hypothetical protein [Saprospiraceae bacterium]